MSYETGQLVWGYSKAIGNIWVVTDGPSRTIALVFDGKNKKYCQDYATTHKDIVRPTSYLYELSNQEWVSHSFANGGLPKWAQDFVDLKGKVSLVGAHLPFLSPAVVQKVQKALNIDLTGEKEHVIVRKDESCPVNGDHKFLPYTGLVHSFEYCMHCDKKRSISNADA